TVTTGTQTDGNGGTVRPFAPSATGIGTLGALAANGTYSYATIFVGNESGGPGSDKLIYGDAAGNATKTGVDQIQSLTNLVVTSSGAMEMNGRFDAVNSLQINQGRTYSGVLNTGPVTSGQLVVETSL